MRRREERASFANTEHFTKALGLHSSKPKGYEPVISGWGMGGRPIVNRQKYWSGSFSTAPSSPLQTTMLTLQTKAKDTRGQRSSKRPPPRVSQEVVPRRLSSLAGGTAPKPVDVLAAIKGSPTLGLSFRMPHHGPHLQD